MKKIKSRNYRIKNLKLLKFLMILLVLFIGVYCNDANAGMNDSLLEKNKKDGVYAVVEIDGENRIFYLNMYEMNDKIAYCIELGVDITTEIYHSTSDFNVSYLSDAQLDYIRAVSYFGYGYDGHDDYKYYMAAQELIWEYLGSGNVEWTNELKVDGKRINIDIYKENILKLIDLDKITIDFKWKDGQVYKVGEEIILTDNNDVLKNYELLSVKHADVSINGNKLIIKVGNVIGEEIIKLKKKDYYDYDSFLYYYDTSQRLISSGNYNRGGDEIIFNVQGVSLNCVIVNSYNKANGALGEGSLAGSVYNIYDNNNNLIRTYESDKTGRFTVDNLLLGNYHIEQAKVGKGFLMPNDKIIFDVEVNKDNLEVKLEQEPIIRKVVITKLYGSNGNYKTESNVEFRLVSNDGKITGRLFTNDQGQIVLRLFYGSYNINQVSTTFGYSMVDDFVIDVKEGGKDIIYYNLIDELVQVKVKINNLDIISGEKLNLVESSYRIKNKNDNTYLKFDGKDVFSLKGNNEVFIPMLLKYGDYVLEQIEVSTGVILNKKPLEFSIDDNSDLKLVDGNLVMEVDFYNELLMGRIGVLAKEEEYYKSINNYGYNVKVNDDSEFILYASDDIIVNGKVVYENGTEVYIGTTNKNGILIIDELYLGNYCLVSSETKEEKCFVLESISNEDSIVERSFEFVKELDKSNITIINTSNEGEVILGSTFEVVDNDGIVVYTGITNDQGIIKIDYLLVGDYCINQKKVVDDYQKNNEKICVFLEEDNVIKVVNNAVVNEIIKVPNTLSESVGFYEILMFLIMMGTVYYVYKKIFSSKLYR